MIGLAQATALLPGVSRSGSTITTGLFQGLARADAARFSFLLGTPITLAGGTKAIIDASVRGDLRERSGPSHRRRDDIGRRRLPRHLVAAQTPAARLDRRLHRLPDRLRNRVALPPGNRLQLARPPREQAVTRVLAFGVSLERTHPVRDRTRIDRTASERAAPVSTDCLEATALCLPPIRR